MHRLIAALVTFLVIGSHAGVMAAAVRTPDVDGTHEADAPRDGSPVAPFYEAATPDDLVRFKLLKAGAADLTGLPASAPSAGAARCLPPSQFAPVSASPPIWRLRGPPRAA
ncbi:MAG: hypothetical protein AB7K63_15705 [Vicinamibacterales bacterium]